MAGEALADGNDAPDRASDDHTRRAREMLPACRKGSTPLVLGAARRRGGSRHGAPALLLHVARDDRRLEALDRGRWRSSRPRCASSPFPAWDTVPYDRIGPNAEIVATPHRGAGPAGAGARKDPTVVLTTVNAILQRVPPRELHPHAR